MGDEERGLLAAIAEQSDADHDRRVYADWLEDHGDGPRAEFVRLQVALARLPDEHPQRTALLTRERGLLFRHEQEWTLGLRQVADGWTFRRGFVDEVTIQNPPRPLRPERFDELFAWPFVRRLSAPRHGWRIFPGLVESEGARRLEELHVADTELNPHWMRALIESPRLERLRRLELVNCGVGANTIQRLARSELLAQLDTLILPDNMIGTDAATALVRSPRVGNLRHLDLRRCRLDADAALAIASAPLLAGLRTLLLQQFLTDESVTALLSCQHLRGLLELELGDILFTPSHFGPEPWNRLTGPGPALPLRRLTLGIGTRLYRSQLFDLISSPRLTSLAKLDLSSAGVEDDGSSRTGPVESSTTPLDLSLSHWGLFLQELFSSVPALRRVRRLAVQNAADDEEILTSLLTSPHLVNLRHLNISCSTGLDRGVLVRLLRSDLAKQLTGLDLDHCDLGDGDVAEIVREHPHLANLTWLSLRNNHVGSRGARALAESPYLRHLRHLDLANNHLDDDGAAHLARAEHLASPVVLDVSGNEIGLAGSAALLGAAERAFSRGVTIPHDDP